MNSTVETKTKAAAIAAMKDCQPCCNSKKRVSIYNPWAQRLVKVAPYSAQAKKLYRFYIEELGFDAAWIAPPDLKFHEDSGRFTRLAEVKSKTSFKSYLSCHTISNVGRVKGFAGSVADRQQLAAPGTPKIISVAFQQHFVVRFDDDFLSGTTPPASYCDDDEHQPKHDWNNSRRYSLRPHACQALVAQADCAQPGCALRQRDQRNATACE